MFLITSLPDTKDLSTLVTTPVIWDNLNAYLYRGAQDVTDTNNEIKEITPHTYI